MTPLDDLHCPHLLHLNYDHVPAAHDQISILELR
jgi:hypothetical protein